MAKFYLESNPIVTMSVFGSDNGVTNQLSMVNDTPPNYNGLTVDDLRDMAPFSRHDKLDSAAIATRELAKSMDVYNKSAFKSAFMSKLQSLKNVKR